MLHNNIISILLQVSFPEDTVTKEGTTLRLE